MSKFIFLLVIAIVAVNIIFIYIFLNKPPQDIVQNPINTSVKNKTVVTKPISNQSINVSYFESNCTNSTIRYVRNIENITNITNIASKYFSKDTDAKSYLLHNWSNNFYDMKGIEKDVKNKTVVSVFEIITNRERNFTLPIICDENGKIGNYSSCLLDNIPNIPSACFNLTINLTECEIEWRDHTILDDIQYWVTPKGGALILTSLGSANKTQAFNFTISSSRKRLESFGMNIIERTFGSIIIDDVIFSSTKFTPDGKGGTIVTNVNLTSKKNVEFYFTVWFKKKCYDKYVIY